MIDQHASPRPYADVNLRRLQEVDRARNRSAHDEDVLAVCDPFAHRFGEKPELAIEMFDRPAFENKRFDGRRHPVRSALAHLDRAGEDERGMGCDERADVVQRNRGRGQLGPQRFAGILVGEQCVTLAIAFFIQRIDDCGDRGRFFQHDRSVGG